MGQRRNIKFALMAATALAASGTTVVAHAAAPSEPAPVELSAPVVHAAGENGARSVSPVLKNAGIAAAITGALAALFRLIGGERLKSSLSKAGPVAARAARTVVSAPLKAAKAVGRAATSPFKFLLILAGIALFALTGVGLYDIEWMGGLAAGAALVAFAWFSAARTRQVFARRRARKIEDRRVSL